MHRYEMSATHGGHCICRRVAHSPPRGSGSLDPEKRKDNAQPRRSAERSAPKGSPGRCWAFCGLHDPETSGLVVAHEAELMRETDHFYETVAWERSYGGCVGKTLSQHSSSILSLEHKLGQPKPHPSHNQLSAPKTGSRRRRNQVGQRLFRKGAPPLFLNRCQ
jgi:hypothetical protein